MTWKLSKSGFSIVPEGTHIFKITNCEWDEDFGKLEITLETANGYKHIERFSLIDNNGEINEKANNAYSYFARTALNNPALDELDHSDLIGAYIESTVEHETVPNRKDPSKTVTFVRLGDKRPASGFAPKSEVTSATSKVNLDDLLG